MFSYLTEKIVTPVMWGVSFVVFVARNTFVAITDLILMYRHAGCVWLQQNRTIWNVDAGNDDHNKFNNIEHIDSTDSNEGLVVQLSTNSPHHSLVNGDDVILHINYDKIHTSLRGNWDSLTEQSSKQQYEINDDDTRTLETFDKELRMLEDDSITWAIVTGIGCGGIGFYSALHLLLCGINVCGVVQRAEEVQEVQEKLMKAVTRQEKLQEAKQKQKQQQWEDKQNLSCESTVTHSNKVHYSAALKVKVCDMSNMEDVNKFVEYLDWHHIADKVHVIICNAGPMCCPSNLTPQNLESQFAIHHVAHSLLLLRLLELRIESHKTKQELFEDHLFPMGRCRSRSGKYEEEFENIMVEIEHIPPLRMVIVSSAALAACPVKQLRECKENKMFHEWNSLTELTEHGPNRFDSYAYAKMCETLFALALSKHIASNNLLSSSLCSVVIVHPGPVRSQVIPHSQLPLKFIIDGPVAALFRLSPVIAACYVVDVALSSKYYAPKPSSSSYTKKNFANCNINGHYFRMGIDVTAQYEESNRSQLQKNISKSNGKSQKVNAQPQCNEAIFVNPLHKWLCELSKYVYRNNNTLNLGLPAPELLLNQELQEQIWASTIQYFALKRLLETKCFLPKQNRKAKN